METAEVQIKNYLEKKAISDLLTGYFRAIDDKCFDLAAIEATFTGDARIVRPNGSETAGHDNILEANKKSFARFKATQHVLTDFIIDLDGAAASLRANLTGMHLWADNETNPSLNGKHFHAGIVLTAKAVKVNDEWRLGELAYRSVWRIGEGMAEMANFSKELKQ
jgi:hypothetical protein